MHIYIYDSFVNQKKYDGVSARIETRITDLGLNGKIIRLGIMNSIYEIVENEIKKGAKTIVAVGNDRLFNQALNAIAHISREITLSRKIPLGFIPVGKQDNKLAGYLGIEIEENACNTLSARRIQTLDLGLANDYYFLTHAAISTRGTTLEIDQNYSIEIRDAGKIFIINLSVLPNLPGKIKPSAQDNVLELFIDSKKRERRFFSRQTDEQSVFPFTSLRVKNQSSQLLIDESITLPTPVDIKIAKEKIHLIVGKGRVFC